MLIAESYAQIFKGWQHPTMPVKPKYAEQIGIGLRPRMRGGATPPLATTNY